MTQHQFPMFVIPNEAGASAAENCYPEYLLGHPNGARTPSPEPDRATDSVNPNVPGSVADDPAE